MNRKIKLFIFALIISLLVSNVGFFQTTQAATLLSDNFTGTTIDTNKWQEIDSAGAGGTAGDIQQSGTLTVANSYNGSIWGQRALVSVDTFDSDGLEISAVMTRVSDQLLGYGDYNFQSAGTKAYILDLVSGNPLALVWNNGSLATSGSCGTYTAGATYKIKIVTGAMEVYKNDVLACSLSTAVTIDDKKVFLESSAAASTFDDVLVTGNGGAATAPGQVTGLSAAAGNAQADLSWSAPASNGGSAITDYLVEYKLTSEPTTWTTFSDGTSTSTSTTVTSLTNGSGYDFRVSAINAIGTGTASSTASATPSAPTAPAAPTIGTAIAGNTSASVSFTANSTGGSPITSYTVTSSPGNITASGSSSPITVTGLTNGQAYTFTVTATNAIGTSSASSASNSVTPNVEVPTSISNLSLWLDGSDSGSMTTSGGLISQINDKSGNNKHATASGALRPTLVSNAQNGRSVMRFDGSNYLSISSAVTYRTVVVVGKFSSASFSDYHGIVGDITGSSPNNGHVLNANGSTKLASATSSFTSAYKNGDSVAGSSGHDFSPINQYWIGVFELPSSVTNTTSVIGAISGGAGRTWNGDIAEVIAYSSTLSSGDRATLEGYLSTKWGITVAGPSAPNAPSGLTADAGNGQVSLSWTAPSNGGSAITDYIVEYKLTSEPTTWTTFSDGTSTLTSATVTSLTNSSSYDFRVKAVNAVGTSSASSTATATPTLPTAPLAPTGVSATAGNAQAIVAFSSGGSGGSPITSYTVTSSPGNITASGSSSPITVTGLTNGQAYTFTVTATNAIGTSSASSASNSVTPTLIGNVLTDSFTGTTIDTSKWVEVDPTGTGGTSGKVQQNGSLTIADSYVGGAWGSTALVSQESFVSTSLEVSASIIAGSSSLIGYGDYLFGEVANKAHLLYLTAPGSGILALSWENGSYASTSCGTAEVGAAVYKMKIVSGGFEVYKNNSLLCTHSTSTVVNNKPVFMETSTTAGTFDDFLVYGTAVAHTAPDAPTIGSVTGGNGQVSVAFSAPAYNGGSPITSYTVTSSPGNITASGSSSPITVTGLTNGQAYTFTVTATNAIGTSSASSASSSVTPAIPPLPGQVTGLTAQGTNKQALLNWDAPGSGGSIDDYIIQYKLSSDSSWSTFSDGTSTATKTVVTGLTNDSAYDFRVAASNSGGSGTVSSTVSATPAAISTLSFVITGESNSGGIGLNSDATSQELASRSAVQIMNLTSGSFLYENLDIGTNNLRDHAGLEGYYDVSHGFELQLANSTEAHAFPDNEQVYLIKTGHGGSAVSQWGVGGGYWTKFLQRTAAGKTQLPANRQWVVWMSLGINDAIAGTNTSTWKTAMVAHINKIKADLPGAIVILTEFQSMTSGSGYPAYNAIMDQIAAEEANVYVVDSTGAALRDGNHWSYSGLKTVASSMVSVTKTALGLIYPGIPTGLSVTPSGTSIGLSWTAPVSNGGASISDYRVEYKLSSDSSWTTFSDGVSTGTSATITGLSGSTNYDVRVSAINSNGAGNTVGTSTSTTDASAPVVSALSTSVTTTTATITWTTDELASTQINYGLTNAYGTTSVLADTSPRVLSHSVALNSLVSCTTYHFRVLSTDASSNTVTGTDQTFTTTCTGSATVTGQAQGSIPTATGGTVAYTIGSSSLNLNIPAGATGSDAVFQIKQLDKTTTFSASGTPSRVNSVGDYAFDLKSLTGIGTNVSSFSSSITLSLTYSDSDVVGIDESTLVIYRYDGTSWSALSDCSVNTSTNTITCTTNHFSIFSLFGSTASGGGSLPLSAFNSPVPPVNGFKLIINKGATSTSNSLVSLSFLAGSDVDKVALSNSPDFTNSIQEPLVSIKNWDLCNSSACLPGQKTVYAKFYTSYGQPSPVINSTIYLSSASKQGVRKPGTNIVVNGTVYTITPEGTRRPYTSAGSFLSYSFNSFKTLQKPTKEELDLPIGEFVSPRDGSIICSDRGIDKNTCYFISSRKKYGFTSEQVFKGLGYSFKRVQYGDVSFLEMGGLIDSVNKAHLPGSMLKISNTYYLMTEQGLGGIPSPTILTSLGYAFVDGVEANSFDLAKDKTIISSAKLSGTF